MFSGFFYIFFLEKKLGWLVCCFFFPSESLSYICHSSTCQKI